jgi:hypothetical protein
MDFIISCYVEICAFCYRNNIATKICTMHGVEKASSLKKQRYPFKIFSNLRKLW